ncbi:MAG: hypothetical protein EOM03_15270 [Clostridia bacterium]|nr:hypothetical protein [Clostridia bacterium]
MIDKSQTPSETAHIWNTEARVDKITRYKWNTETGELGYDAMVGKWDINIDTSYQRNISDSRISTIAKSWQWEAFGRLLVGKREDGRLFIIDGQHRLLAARRRSDVANLPCVVFHSKGSDHEANVFLVTNTARGPMTTLQRFKALLIIGDPIAIAIKDTAEALGLTIPEKSGGSKRQMGKDRNLNCIEALMAAWKTNPQDAERCLVLCQEISNGYAITKDMFSGIFHLNQKMKKVGDSIFNYKEKLKASGYVEIMSTIKNQQIVLGYGGHIVAAAGVLAVINKSKRKKVIIEELMVG